MSLQALRDSHADRPHARASVAHRCRWLLPGALAAALAFALDTGPAAAQGLGTLRCPANTVGEGPDGPLGPATPPVIYDLYFSPESRISEEEALGLLRTAGVGIQVSPHRDISCTYGRDDRRNRAIVVHNPQIVTVDDFLPAIDYHHEGIGHLSVFVHAVTYDGTDLHGQPVAFSHPAPNNYGLGIFTRGDPDEYLFGEDSYGIHAHHSGEGRVGIDVRNVAVRTTGDWAHGVYAWQEGSYILREDGRSTRARGAVVVNLIETARDRAQRVRPLVATGGDNADAVRAEYTRAAARGHIAVTVEGYTIATGGIVPVSYIAIAPPRRPGDYVFDPSRPYVRIKSTLANSPDDEFINILPRDQDSYRQIREWTPGSPLVDFRNLIRGIDLRPYDVVHLPRQNPDYDPDADPETPESKRFIAGEWNPGFAVWNGRYFVALGTAQNADVAACQGESTAEGRRACFENLVAGRSESNLPTGFESRGIYATHEGHGDIRIRATDSDIQTSGASAQGIYAIHTGRTIVCGTPGSGCEEGGGTTPGGGGISIVIAGGAIATEGEDSHGVWARHRGDSGADDADRIVDPDDIGTGNIAIAIDGARIATAGTVTHGVYALIQQTCTADSAEDCRQAENLVAGTGIGDIAIAIDGGVIATGGTAASAVHARHENTGNIALRVTGVAASTEGNQAHAIFADHAGSAGTVSVSVDGGSIATQGDSAQGVRAALAGDGDLTVAIAGSVTTAGENSDGVLALHGGAGAFAVTMTGGSIATTGAEAHGILATRTAGGDVTVTVAGGSVAAMGAGSVGVLARGSGAITVSVAEGASVAGGYVGIQLSAAEAGDAAAPARAVLVDGTVTAAMALTDDLVRDVPSAAIYLPTGGTVSVGASGRVAAASGDAIVSDGDQALAVAVAGRVEGDIRARGAGALTLRSLAGSAIDGTVHDPVGPLTVAGSIGRLLYSSGGAVTVTASGALTGVADEAIRSEAGALSVTVAGTVAGDILGRGTGDHTVTVTEGGTVTGTIHLAASRVAVAGTAGQVRLDRGGVVTVTAGGRISGIEGVAIRSASGDLTANLAGTLAGDVLALGTGVHRVTVAAGGDVAGTVQVATRVGLEDGGSAVALDGAVGRVIVDRGGTFRVGPEGRIRGIGDVAVSSPGGAVVVVLQENPGEQAGEGVDRIQGRIVAPDGQAQVQFQPADGGEAFVLGELNTTAAAPSGPYDLGVVRDSRGGIRVVRDFAPRARVYEAMPSLLLSLNALPTQRDRMAAERNANGAWALVEAGDGAWEASSATSIASSVASDVAYDYRRYGVRAGFEVPVAEDGPVLGIFVHHRRVTADMAWKEGEIEARGTGFGLSASWQSGNGTYLDGQLQGTWHEADLTSGLRGVMKSGATGTGYALAVEAGHRVATLGDGSRAMALVPRVRLVGTRVDMDDFTDAVGSRISLEKGRSLIGRAGLGVEALPPVGSNGRLFGSLDVERAFSSETRVDVAGVPLISEPEETWLRAQLGGAIQWSQGRYALQGALSYGTAGSSNRDLGGNMSLSVRF